MTCPHCADKDERIAWLESELGLRDDLTVQDKLWRALRRPGQHNRLSGACKVIAILYAARGKIVTMSQIAERIPPRNSDERCDWMVVRVWMYEARKQFGAENFATAHGQGGYSLTAAGMAKVREILEGQ